MDRFELASQCLSKGVEQLAKGHSMQELQAMFCQLVKAPQAPKFSDKTAAAKRVVVMAQEVEKSAPALVGVPELNEIFQPDSGVKLKVVRARGRPKAGPRTYTFMQSTHKHCDLLPKQAMAIVQHFPKDMPISSAEVEDRIKTIAADGRLKTKQDPIRIFLYYRAKMISYGWLRMQHD